MLDQEAAFMQIQEAKNMVEEDLQRKLEEFEDEKEQLQKMADSAATLEQELEQVKLLLGNFPRVWREILTWLETATVNKYWALNFF